MDIQKNEALVAEIEQFKEQALKMHIVQVLADTYKNSDLFDCNIDSDGSVIWYKAQARQLWDFWQAAKAQAVPEWISVEDKLPTENGNYLVCIDGDVFYLTAKWVKNHFKFLARGYGLTEDFTDWRYCEGVKVSHWMTLPAAPQEPTND